MAYLCVLLKMQPIIRVVPALAFALGWGVAASALAQTERRPVGEAVRAAALKKYDKNGDGRLNETEREAMRRERANQRPGGERSGRGDGNFIFPPEVVKKYDQDGDGRLSEQEAQAARDGLRKQWEEVQKKYDANSNGRLEPEEMEALRKDAEAGKIEGLPRFFGLRRPRSSSGARFDQPEFLRQFDRNGNGRLSEGELKAARAARERLRAEQTDREKKATP